jgi:uncharacterized protein (TIRG00374 family)
MARYDREMKTDRITTPTTATRKIFRWLWLAFSSVFIIWVLFYELDWRAVTAALNQANYFWVTAGIIVTIVAIFTRTWRWKVLLYRFDTHTFGLMTALLIGQAVNLVLPLRSGDVMRVIWFREIYGSSGTEALGTVAIEKVWDVLALLLCGILMIFIMPLPATYVQTVWTTSILLIIGVVILITVIRWRQKIVDIIVKWTQNLSPRIRIIVLPRIEEFLRGIEVIKQSRVSTQVFFITLAVWLFYIITNWTIMAAFGVYSFSAAILLMATLMSGNMIVPIPGRLGVFEAVVIGTLSLYDVPRDTSLAIGLVLHMVSMGTPMVAAIFLAIANTIRREMTTFFH